LNADGNQYGLGSKIVGFIELCRPVNCSITAVVVWVGGVLASSSPVYFSVSLMLAAFSAALIAAGGNIYNDVKDREIDNINRQDRPIPSGRVGFKSAIWLFGLLTFIGLFTVAFVNPDLFLMALITAIFLLDYNENRSRSLIVGNFIIGLCAGLAFVYGAIAVGNPVGGILPGIFAMLIHFGREIVKDIEDIEGDGALGARTLPIVRGELFAQRTAAFVLLLLVIVTVLPFVSKLYSDRYLYMMIPLVDIPLILISFSLFRKLNKRKLHINSVILKVIMLSGLLVLFLGKI